MNKKVLVMLFFLSALTAIGQSRFKIEISVPEMEDASTGGPVWFTLIGEKGQVDFKIDNPNQDDFQLGTKSVFFTPRFNIGKKITDIRIEARSRKKGKFIDDLYISKIKITNIGTGQSSGNIFINSWIGDGASGKEDKRVKTVEVKKWN